MEGLIPLRLSAGLFFQTRRLGCGADIRAGPHPLDSFS